LLISDFVFSDLCASINLTAICLSHLQQGITGWLWRIRKPGCAVLARQCENTNYHQFTCFWFSQFVNKCRLCNLSGPGDPSNRVRHTQSLLSVLEIHPNVPSASPNQPESIIPTIQTIPINLTSFLQGQYPKHLAADDLFLRK